MSLNLNRQLEISETNSIKISKLVIIFHITYLIGKLKVESTETILVDIRQSLVNCDQSKNRILKEVDKVMTDLIETLKNRKNEVLAIVDDYFKQEKDQIVTEELKWRERQRICEELLKLSSKKDTD